MFSNKLKDVLHFNFLEYDFLSLFFCFNNLTSIIEKKKLSANFWDHKTQVHHQNPNQTLLQAIQSQKKQKKKTKNKKIQTTKQSLQNSNKL